jgi:hypothetical protein
MKVIGCYIKIISRIQDQGVFVAIVIFYATNECFLAGKPPRLILTSPARRDIAHEISTVNNSQAFRGFPANVGAVRSRHGKYGGQDHADKSKCIMELF